MPRSALDARARRATMVRVSANQGSPESAATGASRRTATMMIATALTVFLIWAVSLAPVPYAVEGPGPTLDTLGEQDGKPLITIRDATTYPTSGKLLATTVSIWGGPDNGISLLRLVSLWASGDSVIPEHYVFDVEETKEHSDEVSASEQTNSQEDATVAALGELGTPVPATLTVAQAMPDGPADGTIEEGDVLSEINGTVLVTYSDLVTAMGKVKPGDKVEVGFTRGGTAKTASIKAAKGADGGAILGLALSPTYDIPVDVEFNIENVGGPSAGTMYALGIIDQLTPGELTGGKTIAGTGTIDAAGRVGAIGGTEQKLRGAERDGAKYFLVPTSNCGDLAGQSSDAQVIPITTLHEAHKYVQDIADGSTGDLPACPAS